MKKVILTDTLFFEEKRQKALENIKTNTNIKTNKNVL